VLVWVRAHMCVCACTYVYACVYTVVYVRVCMRYVLVRVFVCVRVRVCVRVCVRSCACERIEDAVPLGVLPPQDRASLPSCLYLSGLGGFPSLSPFTLRFNILTPMQASRGPCNLLPILRGGEHVCVGWAKTIYIRRIYGNSGREITRHTVTYGVYIRFWPTLCLWYAVI